MRSLKPFFIAGFLFLSVVQGSLFVAGLRRALAGDADFVAFYAAGVLASRGQSHELVHISAMASMEQEVRAGRGGSVLPFTHPAFESVWLRPLASLSYRQAYILFFALNLGALAMAFVLLQPSADWSANLWSGVKPSLFATFLPVGICLLQGQDSILLLMLLAAAYRLLREDYEFFAGIALGLGVFRFQLVLPIAALYLVWRKWKFVGGVAASLGFAICVSIWVAGPSYIHTYPALLRQISIDLGSANQSLSLGVWPSQMPNIRGFLTFLFSNVMSTGLLQMLILAVSLALWIWAAVKKLCFEACVIAAFLLGYHSNMHDAVLLLIPLAAAWRTSKRLSWGQILVWSMVVLLPSLCFAAAVPVSFFAVVAMIFLLSISPADSLNPKGIEPVPAFSP